MSNGEIESVNLTFVTLDKALLQDYINEVKKDINPYLVVRRSTNDSWDKKWLDYLNRDDEINDLINRPERYDVKVAAFPDKKGTSFYIFKYINSSLMKYLCSQSFSSVFLCLILREMCEKCDGFGRIYY